MATYVYTGDARRTTCKVTRSTDGVLDAGYPKTYYIYNSFTDPLDSTVFAALTLLEFSRLSDANYATRLAAFYRYVESVNAGLDTSTDLVAGYEPTVTDAAVCDAVDGTEDTRTESAP